MLDSQVWRSRARAAPEVRAAARHLAARLRVRVWMAVVPDPESRIPNSEFLP